MKKHGFRSIFSLLLALMMVCSMLPTAAFAEGDVEEQSVVVEPVGTPAEEPKQDEDSPAPEDPKTFTVTYTDGAGGAVFDDKVHSNLSFGTATPAFDGTLEREGYTFAGWNPAVAETVTADVTYTALWQEVQQEAQSDVQPEADGNVATVREQVGKEILLLASNSSVPLTLRISSYGAPFKNGSTGEHNVNTYTWLKYIRRSDVGSDNARGSAHAYFRGSNESGWQLWLKVEVGNYKYEEAQSAWVYNKDMSAATGDITYGLSFNSSGGTSTYISISGAKDQPQPTPFTFILKFDVNGGTGTFADVTRQSSAQYEMLQIPSNYVPTREGHTFKGWKDTYWDSTYQVGASVNVNRTDAACTVTDTSCTKTLCAVWEKNAPNGPTSGKVAELLGQVKVHCTTPIAGHEDQTYDLYYALSSMVMAPDGSGYTCDVRVEADEYVTKYNKKDYPGTDHVLADGEKRIRSFVLRNDNDGKGWYISEGENLLPIVFNVKCEAPTPPTIPTDKEIERALSGKVNVVVSCVTENSGHPSERYPLFAYVSGLTKPNPNEVTANSDGTYSYTVSFLASNFVKMYSQAAPFGIGSDHELADTQDLRTVTLTLRDSTVGWTATTQNINVSAKCEEQQPQPDKPAAPDDGTVKRTLTNAVKITCITNSGHAPQTYDLASGFTPGTVEGNASTGYTYTIFVSADKYVGWYSETLGVNHTLDDTSPKPITLKWDDGAWVAETNLPINFDVKCEAENPPVDIKKPTFDELKALLSVKVECTNESANHETKSDLYALKNNDEDSQFDIGEVNQSGDAPTCTVTIGSQPYVAAFDGTTGKAHNPADTTKTVDLVYNKETRKWALENENDAPVVFQVACTTEEPSKPYKPNAEDLLSVVIHCKSDVHNDGLYDLTDGIFTVGEVEGNEADGYTCKVTVEAAQYVNKYIGEMKVNHDIVGEDTKTVTLKYESALERWTVDSTVVTFDVECIPAPNISMLQVQVHCVTPNSSHMDEFYDLPEDTTLEYVDANTRRITVQAAPYVEQYGNGHKLADGESESKTITATWDGVKWNFDATSVTFDVKCKEEPVEEKFPVHLVIYRNGNTSKPYTDIALEGQPKGHVIDLSTIDIADYYTGNYEFYGWYDDGLFNIYKADPANPPAGLKEKAVNGWTNFKCMVYDYVPVVYFQSVEAWRDFQNDHSKTEGRLYSTTALFGSTLPTADAPTPTRTGYTFKFWSREGQNGDVTGQTVNGWTNLYAVWEKNTYTVTYTDGVNGEAFKDQAYTAKYEDATPAFEGTPTRDGYTFQGWEPEVAETVTDNATYTAKWEEESTQPDGPTAEQVDSQLNVKVSCANLSAAHQKNMSAFVYETLLPGSFDIGEVTGNERSGYSCQITVRAAQYVQDFAARAKVSHTLTGVDKKTVTLYHQGGGWTVGNGSRVVDFTVNCVSEPVVTYTVTYLDGANGKAFASQVYTGLKLGDTTPRFNGTPVRSGYVFIGWSPMWSGTVTGNVTYTATWSTITGGLDKVPKTGDNGLTLALSALLLFSFCGAAACVVSTKKRG